MAVSDIEKLRPELLEKSRAELARLKAEIELAEAELSRRELVKAKEALAAEANQHIDAVVAGVKWLHDNGLLPDKVAAGFKREGDGMFSPSMFLRNVTAESLAGGKPQKRRGRMTPAEREAAIAAGTLKPRKRRAA
ncbi:hypothetical protein [Aquamicrobium soli]|uniref:H-NS histone family protein n=1 Tax=Aquamicrobium soli TaxID=1811518 RepID=A0ABV7K9Z7_9HYPH